MTERLYYADSLLTAFDACVTQVKENENGIFAALDRSAFYPTSGGQPADTGVLTLDSGETVCVTDVNVDKDGEVWHTLSAPVAVGVHVHGEINWARRQDHMEQHGGEHLLAGAIWTLLQGTTIGLHTGAEDATIDVVLPDGRVHMTDDEIYMLENWVNEKIRRNDAVSCTFPDEKTLKNMPLRKAPTVNEHIRVVAYGDYEYCACGGTHPPYTGMIGLVKILSVTPARGKARVRFVCGQRAFKCFQSVHASCEKAGALLSCSVSDVPSSIEKLQKRLIEKEQEKNALAEKLADCLARDALHNVRTLRDGCTAAVLHLPGGDRKTLIDCAGKLIDRENSIALLSMPSEKGGVNVVFACHEKAQRDMNALMRACGVRGGGKKDFAQGSAENADVLERAFALL